MTPRERRLQRYGLTVAQYDMILRTQNGACAICKRPPVKLPLHVDHNHRTGLIRGLLCHRCNRGLGYFSEQHHLVAAAGYFLAAHTGYYVPKKKRKKKAA